MEIGETLSKNKLKGKPEEKKKKKRQPGVVTQHWRLRFKDYKFEANLDYYIVNSGIV